MAPFPCARERQILQTPGPPNIAGVQVGVRSRTVERLSRLAFVTSAIVEAICQGQQRAELNAETLFNRIDLPLDWPAQRNALGIN